MAKYVVYIDGAAGTTGLQIYSRLAAQDDITLLTLPDETRKDFDARLSAINNSDIAVLCLPDDAAKEIASAAGKNAKICDASTAHRTKEGWVYGFAELNNNRDKIKTANRVAVPGCHASGFLALTTPLVEKNVLKRDALVYCHSLSGYSGAGKSAIAEYEDDNRNEKYNSPRIYSLQMAHKHLPEMKAVSGLANAPMFCPVICNYYSGMLVTVPLNKASFTSSEYNRSHIYNVLNDYYKNEPLINVKQLCDVPSDSMLSAEGMHGRDDLEIYVLGSDENILLASRFDNLGKGAAGAAMQCINLILGKKETSGLFLPQKR